MSVGDTNSVLDTITEGDFDDDDLLNINDNDEGEDVLEIRNENVRRGSTTRRSILRHLKGGGTKAIGLSNAAKIATTTSGVSSSSSKEFKKNNDPLIDIQSFHDAQSRSRTSSNSKKSGAEDNGDATSTDDDDDDTTDDDDDATFSETDTLLASSDEMNNKRNSGIDGKFSKRRDRDAELFQIAKDETIRLRIWRIIIIFTILLSGAIITTQIQIWFHQSTEQQYLSNVSFERKISA